MPYRAGESISIFDKRLLKIFGANVRRLRLERGYSAQKLGELVGIQGQTVFKIEGGHNTSLSRMFTISRALEATWADLLGGCDQLSLAKERGLTVTDAPRVI